MPVRQKQKWGWAAVGQVVFAGVVCLKEVVLSIKLAPNNQGNAILTLNSDRHLAARGALF